MHGLAEALVPQEAVDDVAAAEILDFLDVVPDPALKLLDLHLILLGELLDIMVEGLILRLLLFRQ